LKASQEKSSEVEETEKSPSTSFNFGKVKLPKSPDMANAPLMVAKLSSEMSCNKELLKTRNSPSISVKLAKDNDSKLSLAKTWKEEPTVFNESNSTESKPLYPKMKEPLTASKDEMETSPTSWMVKLAAQTKFSNLMVALSLLNDKVKPSVTVFKVDKSMDEMFLLLLTFNTPMVLKFKRESMDDKAVSDKVSEETLAKPEFKLSWAKDGNDTNDNSSAEVNLEKSMLFN